MKKENAQKVTAETMGDQREGEGVAQTEMAVLGKRWSLKGFQKMSAVKLPPGVEAWVSKSQIRLKVTFPLKDIDDVESYDFGKAIEEKTAKISDEEFRAEAIRIRATL